MSTRLDCWQGAKSPVFSTTSWLSASCLPCQAKLVAASTCTTKEVALNETLANHKHQALSQGPFRFNCDVSLMSIFLMTPCLRSCTHSCLLVRVSPNHNALPPTMEDPRSLTVLPVQPMTESKSAKSKNMPYELKGLDFVEEFFLEHKLTHVQRKLLQCLRLFHCQGLLITVFVV